VVDLGVKTTDPVNLDVSVPPSVSSPLTSAVSDPLSGANETPKTSVVIVPWLLRLSMKVGTVLDPETVPEVSVTGPNPMIPSTPVNPDDLVPSPILCLVTVTPPTVTVSVNSVPETDPLP